MRRSIFVIALVAAVLVGACSRVINADQNLTVINQSSSEIGGVAVYCEGSSSGVQRADKSAMEKGEKTHFEMGNGEASFDLAVSDTSGDIVTMRSFQLSFSESEKHTVYILDSDDGGVYLSE